MYRCLSLLALGLLTNAIAAVAEQSLATGEDHIGDPLPKGAIARLGTIRWRHDAIIDFAAFLPDGKSVISASRDGDIRVWAFPSGILLRRIKGSPFAVKTTNAVTLSHDGKLIASSFKAGTGDQEIRIHEIATGKELACLNPPSTYIYELAFSAVGRQLQFRESSVGRIWDWATGTELAKFATNGSSSLRLYDEASIDCVAHSPDKKTLLSFGLTNTLGFVDLATGQGITTNPGHRAPVLAAWFTPDGKHILTRDVERVHRWDAATGKHIGPVVLASQPGRRVQVSVDGKLGISSPGSVQDDFVDIDALLGGLGGGGFGGGAFVPIKGAVAAAKSSDTLLFDLASGKPLGKFNMEATRSLGPIVFSPDGKCFALQTTIDEVKILSLANAKQQRIVKLPSEATASSTAVAYAALPNMMFSPDGKTLAYQQNSNASAVVLFDVATGKQTGILRLKVQEDPAPANPANPINPPLKAKGKGGKSAKKTPLQGAHSPDGRSIALVHDLTAAVYELASGQPRLVYEDQSPGGAATPAAPVDRGPLMAYSPDGKLLARIRYDGKVVLIDIMTGKELAVFNAEAAKAPAVATGKTKGKSKSGPTPNQGTTAVAFAPDGTTLVATCTDGTGLIWDVAGVPRSPPPNQDLQPADLAKLWQALASDDAAIAWTAIGELTSAPKVAVEAIQSRLKPVAVVDPKRVGDLLAQLADNQYKVRESAGNQLFKMGDQIVPALENALAANPPLEARSRLEELHGKLTGTILHGERLQAYRAVEVLELIGTAEARQMLKLLAAGAPGAQLTTSAQVALERSLRASQEPQASKK